MGVTMRYVTSVNRIMHVIRGFF